MKHSIDEFWSLHCDRENSSYFSGRLIYAGLRV